MAADKSSLLVVGICLALFAAIAVKAVAQALAVPGSSHGFVIDKRLVAGVNCTGCRAFGMTTP